MGMCFGFPNFPLKGCPLNSIIPYPLIADYKMEDLIGENGILKQLTKERAMQAEITDHLGYPRNAPAGKNSATPGTAATRRSSRATLARLTSRFPVTGTAPSSRSSFPREKPASRGLTTRSSPCMPGGGPPAMDAVRNKVKHNGQIIKKAVYSAIAVTMTEVKEVLGMWAAETEGAKFWLNILTELRNRGVKDILIACVDGLKGFPEAIEAVELEGRS